MCEKSYNIVGHTRAEGVAKIFVCCASFGVENGELKESKLGAAVSWHFLIKSTD